MKYYGWVPNSQQAAQAAELGMASDTELLRTHIVPWDATDQPTVTTWDSYADFCEEEAEKCDAFRRAGQLFNWWEAAKLLNVDVKKLMIASQGAVGSCAGVSLYDRCYQMTLLNQIAAGSEQAIESVNALATWLISKNGSRSGGQTIAAALRYGAELGVYPAALVGSYDATARYERRWRNFDADAQARQIGSAVIESHGESLARIIVTACRANKAVEIGNSLAVRDGVTRDVNGVYVVNTGGYWMHATAFCGYQKIAGDEYVFWANSHGNIYSASDGTPDFGAWMDYDTLVRFCSGSYCDAAVVTYVESPQGLASNNLNPVFRG